MTPPLHVEICDPFLWQFPIEYATAGAAGIDLRAACMAEGMEHVEWVISSRFDITIPCGVKVIIPPGYEGNIRLRSGLGFKQHLGIHNGTIDADYRGEVKAQIFNHGPGSARIKPGERFAQLVIHPVLRPEIVIVDDVESLSPSARGTGGFGSTGTA